jgi:TLD
MMISVGCFAYIFSVCTDLQVILGRWFSARPSMDSASIRSTARWPASIAPSYWLLRIHRAMYTIYSFFSCLFHICIIDFCRLNRQVFGAVTSCELRVSESFYGTGESFIFLFNPKLHVYSWTGENSYFIKGNNESLAIGAGE